jgi:NitT/TauT family transport system ATP-binding protein
MAWIVLGAEVAPARADSSAPTSFSEGRSGMGVHLQGVTKAYADGAPVIEGLDLVVEEGDFISLIGPSGCGKSTLLKLIAGLTSLSSGTISIGDLRAHQARKWISYIFQEATLLPWRTVYDNVALSLELEDFPRRERDAQVRAVLEKVGLKGCAERYPRQLSGGMKMRVSIARALVTSPRILLMDEPFGALDEMTRDRLHEELLRLKVQQAWTAFFVTHSVSEAVFLSNRVVVLGANPGRLASETRVPFPYPRLPALRSDPAFLNFVGQVSDALRGVAPPP